MKKLMGFTLIVAIFIMFPFSVQSAEKAYNLTWQGFSHSKHRSTINFKRFGDAIMAASNGKIKFNYHYGEPVPMKEMLDACGKGTLDVINTGAQFYSGKVGIGDFVVMPSNFRTWQDMFDLFVNTELWDIVDSVYRKAANVTVISFTIFSSENFQVGKRSKKIRGIEDFNGLKIRGSGGAPNICIKALGATPVLLIAGEYYVGMQRGTIDAGLNPMYTLEGYKMWEVCDQVVDPPVFPKCANLVFMNLDVWNSLPKDIQNTIRRLARDPQLYQESVKYVEEQDERIAKIAKEDHGVEFYTLPKEDAEKMYKKVEPVWDWYVENCSRQGFGEEAKKIREIISSRFYGN